MKNILFLLILFSINSFSAKAQSDTIITIAGNGTTGYSGEGGEATSVSMKPTGVAIDALGNMYISNGFPARIFKVNTKGITYTLAGNGANDDPYSGDGGQATAAGFVTAASVAVGDSGQIYFSDGRSRIRKINKNGIISTVAGNGDFKYYGDGGAATAAALNMPIGVVTDVSGNIYIADMRNNCVRKVDKNGIISTIAGKGTAGYSGDGGNATAAQLNGPTGIAIDDSGAFSSRTN